VAPKREFKAGESPSAVEKFRYLGYQLECNGMSADFAKRDAPASDAQPVPAGLLPCDIVMKGGVTSGVLYPSVVWEISRLFSFKNVGGTSAGAIAAVV
jgi:hypothetical protein